MVLVCLPRLVHHLSSQRWMVDGEKKNSFEETHAKTSSSVLSMDSFLPLSLEDVIAGVVDRLTSSLEIDSSRQLPLSSLLRSCRVFVNGQEITHRRDSSTDYLLMPLHGLSCIEFRLRLCGGKGGFGAQLRSKSMRVGQKKTSNFDACRDLSGKRLRLIRTEEVLRRAVENGDEEAARFLKPGASEKAERKARKAAAYAAKPRLGLILRDSRGELGSGNLPDRRKHRSVSSSIDSSASHFPSVSSSTAASSIDDDRIPASDLDVVADAVSSGFRASLSYQRQESSSARVKGGINSQDSHKRPASRDVPVSLKRSCPYDRAIMLSGFDDFLDSDSEENSTGSESSASPVSPSSPSMSDSYVSPPPSSQEKTLAPSNLASPLSDFGTHLPSISGSVPHPSPVRFKSIESMTFEELCALGADMLKNELQKRGLKCGGTVEDRANRLLAVRGLSSYEYPARLLAKIRS